jgi:hypothetical protein
MRQAETFSNGQNMKRIGALETLLIEITPVRHLPGYKLFQTPMPPSNERELQVFSL